jgi:hypothetical protein
MDREEGHRRVADLRARPSTTSLNGRQARRLEEGENRAVLDEIERLYSDAEVARLLDPTCNRIKARSIRSEREAARLVGTRVAGKWMYRKSDVVNFLQQARICQEPTVVPDSSRYDRKGGPSRYLPCEGIIALVPDRIRGPRENFCRGR